MSRVFKRLEDFKFSLTSSSVSLSSTTPPPSSTNTLNNSNAHNNNNESINNDPVSGIFSEASSEIDYLVAAAYNATNANTSRPCTARSLPTPNTTSSGDAASASAANNQSIGGNGFLNVSAVDRTRNFSYPNINVRAPSPQPQPKIITVIASKSTIQSGGGNETSTTTLFSDTKRKPSTNRRASRLSIAVTTNPNEQPSDTLPSPSPSNALSSGGSKSNLDYFLDYSCSPFTTKYEIIGNNNNSSSKPPLKPNSNINLKELDSELNSIKRSASISNLNDADNGTSSGAHHSQHASSRSQRNNNYLLVDSIISPNLIKTSYAASSSPPSPSSSSHHHQGRHQRNNSTSNLFPPPGQMPLPPPSARKFQAADIASSRKMASISDENIAASVNNYRTKFKLSNKNGLISNNQLVRISDWVYCGNLNSVKNERALCQLGIEYIIDMSNMRPDDLSRAQTLGRLPCRCKRKQHSRLYLTIELRETNFKALFGAYNEVNKFIQQAKNAINNSSSQKRVLIFGREGLASDHVRCACAQYLMVDCGMNMTRALNVLQARSKGSMQKCYLEYLSQFEIYLDHMSKNMASFPPASTSTTSSLAVSYGYSSSRNEDDPRKYSSEAEYDFDDMAGEATTTNIDVDFANDDFYFEHDEGGGGADEVESLNIDDGHVKRAVTSAANKSKPSNDLELDNLSDLSDNFATNSAKTEPAAAAAAAAAASSTSNRNLERRIAHNRFKMAWM